MLARYFFGGAQVWKLARVPLHYQEEARVILQAQHEARIEIAKKGGSGMAGPATVSLPEY